MKIIKYYADPAIGFPVLGWAIRWHRMGERGFGIWSKQMDAGLYIALWRSYRFEWVRIPPRMRQ